MKRMIPAAGLDSLQASLSNFFMGPVTIGRIFGFMAGTKIIGFFWIELNKFWSVASQGVMGCVAQGPVVGLHAGAQGDLLRVFDFERTY